MESGLRDQPKFSEITALIWIVCSADCLFLKVEFEFLYFLICLNIMGRIRNSKSRSRIQNKSFQFHKLP